MMDTILQDVRYALRALRRNPGFTLAAVLCFALGIGVNATVFGVVDTLMFRPPTGVRNPGRVVRLYFSQTTPPFGHFTMSSTSYLNLGDLRGGVPAFAEVAGFWTRKMDVGRGASADQASGSIVTASFFPLLGVRPALGRYFGADDDRPGAPPTTVLGYGYWRRRFAGDSGALGRALQIGKALYTVIGVAPEGFAGVDLEPVDLWLPAAVAGPALVFDDVLTSRGSTWIQPLARLRPGATREQAASEATLVYRRGDAVSSYKDPHATVILGGIQQARGPEASGSARVSVWLGLVSALVLLIACANVANLLLARALRRRREMAVRMALGAGAWRLARQLVTESVALALVGAGVALLVAVWSGPLLRAYVLPRDAVSGPPLDLRVLGFTAVIAAVTGLISGLVPALQASRPDVAVALKAGAREGTYQRSRVRAVLLVAQTSLTLVLVAGTGLFARSLRNVLRHDVGLDAPHLLNVDVDVFHLGYARERVDALYRRLLARAEGVPGVERTALSLGGPFGWSFGRRYRVPGLDTIPIPAGGGQQINAVTPGFFETVGTPILRGRAFTDADREGAAKVMVVSRTMAQILWPRGDALGSCVILGGDSTCTEVVGVVADVLRNHLVEGRQLASYLPLAQWDNGHRTLWVRTRGDPHLVVADLQRALGAAAPDLPYVGVRPVEDLVEGQYWPWRLGTTVLAMFSGLALMLAALGLYGVLAFTVAQRTQELGVRIALGALPRDVFALVVRQGLGVAGLGVGLGVVLALVAGKVLASLLYGVSPRDPLVIAASATVLLAAAALASWIPARRATRVDPVVALRSE
jgi:predicted permease